MWVSRDIRHQPANSRLGGVDVDPATGQRGTKLVEPGQAGSDLVDRFGDGQDQGLNDDERGGVAGEEAECLGRIGASRPRSRPVSGPACR